MSEKSAKSKEETAGLRKHEKLAPGMVGSGTGAAISLGMEAFGVPGGAVLGSVVGPLITGLWQDFLQRQLSNREKERVDSVLSVAINEIGRRKAAGENLRTDGFFDEKETGRSDAEEILEAVLLKAQREPEEKKIRHLGLLYSSFPFDSDISVPYANQLIKVAEQLTYRQLCILKLCDVKDKYNLRDKDYRDQNVDKKDLYQVLYECAELDNKQYINSRGKADLHGREFADFGATIDGLTRAIPSCMSLQGLGKDLFNLMKLSLIPCRDITPISEQLK